jgi:hypothetical protein
LRGAQASLGAFTEVGNLMSAVKTAMQTKEHPILFSGEMVKAILEGRKTQTRRVIKPQPTPKDGLPGMIEDLWYWDALGPTAGECHVNRSEMEPLMVKACPYGKVGSKLWVRGAHTFLADGFGISPSVAYRADGFQMSLHSLPDGTDVYNSEKPDAWKWRPSIFMPREASRITLEIINIRVEKLQSIALSFDDLQAEGFIYDADEPCVGPCGSDITLNMSERLAQAGTS